jgi:hypothetical protein
VQASAQCWECDGIAVAACIIAVPWEQVHGECLDPLCSRLLCQSLWAATNVSRCCDVAVLYHDQEQHAVMSHDSMLPAAGLALRIMMKLGG